MAPEELRRVARGLLTDYDARTPGRSLGPTPGFTVEDAYELQDGLTRLREARGEKVVGYKVGCTSRAIREQLGVAQPVFGRLFDTGCFRSGAHLPHGDFAGLAVEGELAVCLSRDLTGGPISAAECLGAVAGVFPVIELHHYTFPPAWSPGSWLVASNGLHAGFVRADEERQWQGPADFRHRLTIRMDGVAVESFADSAAVPGPLASLCWLAGRLAESGLCLTAGQVVLTGSAMKLYPVSPGSRITVDAGPLGQSCAVVVP